MFRKNIVKSILKFIFLLAIFGAFSTAKVEAQNKERAKFESLIALGDDKFDFNFHQDALYFYQRAFQIDSSDYYLNYRIGESYRLMYRYSDALKYYVYVSQNDLEHYPLSLFYYALILKYEGKYKPAIVKFEEFIEQAKDISPKYFTNKKAFFQRALVEMEGCYWSIEQLFKYTCINVHEPVNTEYNDFAPVIFANDSDIIVISGRKSTKLTKDTQDGEANTKMYRFTKTGDKWKETENEDNFEETNSKYNDGPGVFNADKTQYYYTSCGREDSYCKIYFKEKKGKKWSNSKKLNDNINAPESDNKQPTLSETGDSMYFVSDRPGGYGKNDIWLSIKQSDGSWGQAVNLGDAINTPFNEVSPFYLKSENAITFSSDGHKGFGGLDIFIAKKDRFDNYSITNLSDPFNTNLDECYFTVGEGIGYIASNREGGEGQFDIYTFSNPFMKTKNADYQEKLKELSEQISTIKYDVEKNTPEIPTELVNVDAQTIYDRILSAKVAALLYDVPLKFFEPDYHDFESLTIDDKSIIDMYYMSIEVDINNEYTDSIKKVDQQEYNELSEENIVFVERLANNYINSSGGATFVKITEDDQKKYKELKVQDKEYYDRLIAYKIRKIKEDQNATAAVYTSEINIKSLMDSSEFDTGLDDRTYESIISTRLAGFIYNFDLPLNINDYTIYSKLDIADVSMLDMDYKSRAFELVSDVLDSIKFADAERYFMLDDNSRNRIDRMAEICKKNEFEESVEFSTIDLQYIQNSAIQEKRVLDRLIAYKCGKDKNDSIAKLEVKISKVLPGVDTSIVNKEKQDQYDRILSVKLAGFVYGIHFQYTEPDYRIYESFTSDDKGFVETLYSFKTAELDQNILRTIKIEDRAEFSKLEQDDKAFIEDVAYMYSKTSYDSAFVRLRKRDATYYSSLNITQKRKFDRLIAFQLNEMIKAKSEAIVKYVDIVQDELGINDKEETGKLFTEQELNDIERILSFKIACYVHNLTTPFLKNDFDLKNTLTIEDNSILDMMYSTKVFSMQDPDVVQAIRKADANQYKKLPQNEKSYIDRIAQLFVFASDTAKFVELTESDATRYNNLDINAKYKTDRLLLYKLKDLYTPEENVASIEEHLNQDLLYVKEMSSEGKLITDVLYNKYEKILSVMIAGAIHGIKMPYIYSDYLIYNSFDVDDLSLVYMMFDTKNIRLKDQKITDSLRIIDNKAYTSLKQEIKNTIDRIANSYLDIADEQSIYTKIQDSDTAYYNNLTIKQKNKTDRIIASRLRYFRDAIKVEEQLSETIVADELSLEDISESELVDVKETSAYERIISFMLACYIYDVSIPLNESDYSLSKELSIDELSIMDMMYSIKSSTFKDVLMLDSVKTADRIAMNRITSEQNIIINNLVDSYLEEKDSVSYIKMKDGDLKDYNKLSIQEKFKLDRLWVSQLSMKLKEQEAVNVAEESIVTDDFSQEIFAMSKESEIISEADYSGYERILSIKLANYIYGIDVAMIQSDYEINEKFSIDDKSILDMMLEMRIIPIEDAEVRALLQKSDASKYERLEENDKKFIDRIVDKYVNTNINETSIVLEKSDLEKYSVLDIKQKYEIDRVIMSRLKSLIFSPENYIESGEAVKEDLTENIKELVETTGLVSNTDFETYERVLSMLTASYVYNKKVPLIESDYKLYTGLSDDDLSIIDLIFMSRSNMLSPELIDNMRKSDILLYNNLSETDKQFITKISDSYKRGDNSRFVRIPIETESRYKKVSIVEKNRFDRLILASLGGIYEEPVDNTSIGEGSEKTHVLDFHFNSGDCKNQTITGFVQVTDKQANVNNIKIQLVDESGSEQGFSYTDISGNFKFFNKPGGTKYTLVIDRTSLSQGSVYSINDFKLSCNDTLENKVVEVVSTMDNSKPVRPIENVFFDYDKSDLNTDAINVLNSIVLYYKENNNCVIFLNAFTDNTGADDYNMHLSRQRARSVMFYLIDKGIPGKNIKAHAEGKENPSVPNSNQKSRAINRRVEIVVMAGS